MSLDKQATENLQIIRSLMERSTIYRAISASTAFVGGTASILMGFFGENLIRTLTAGTKFHRFSFIISWGIVLGITNITHLYQLYRDSIQNNDPIFSSRHWLAIRCMSPVFIMALICMFFGSGLILFEVTPEGESVFDPHLIVVFLWCAFYGMALLSTQTFAPKSIIYLGLVFFITGVFTPLIAIGFHAYSPYSFISSQKLMALTFGLFHIIYAITVWKTSEKQSAESVL